MDILVMLGTLYLIIGAVYVVMTADDIVTYPEDYKEISGTFILLGLFLCFIGWIVLIPLSRYIEKRLEKQRQKHHSSIFLD